MIARNPTSRSDSRAKFGALRALVTMSLLICVASAATLSACRAQPQIDRPRPPVSESPRAASLWRLINETGYKSWRTAPGYDAPQPGKGTHGDAVQVFLDETAATAPPLAADAWPVGSILVIDVYTQDALVNVAAMRKRMDGKWFWAEWDADGNEIEAGVAAQPCEGCHVRQGTDRTISVTPTSRQ